MAHKFREIEVADREVSVTADRRADSGRDADLTLRSANGALSFHVFYHDPDNEPGFEHMVRFFNDSRGSRYDISVKVAPTLDDITSMRKTDGDWAKRLLLSLNDQYEQILPPLKFSFENETLGPANPDGLLGRVTLYAYRDQDKYRGHSVTIEVRRSTSSLHATLDPLLR